MRCVGWIIAEVGSEWRKSGSGGVDYCLCSSQVWLHVGWLQNCGSTGLRGRGALTSFLRCSTQSPPALSRPEPILGANEISNVLSNWIRRCVFHSRSRASSIIVALVLSEVRMASACGLLRSRNPCSNLASATRTPATRLPMKSFKPLVTSWAPISFQHCLQGVLQIVTSDHHPPYQTAIAIQTSLQASRFQQGFGALHENGGQALIHM